MARAVNPRLGYPPETHILQLDIPIYDLVNPCSPTTTTLAPNLPPIYPHPSLRTSHLAAYETTRGFGRCLQPDMPVPRCHQKPARNTSSVSLACAHLTFIETWGTCKYPVPVYKNDGLVGLQTTQCHPPRNSFTRATKSRRYRTLLPLKANWLQVNSGYVHSLLTPNVPSAHALPAVANHERSVEC
jgi:hypothetical protein